MKYQLYECGGKIRDEFLGLESKDIDYSVVIQDFEQYDDPFKAFVEYIEAEGYNVFETKESCFTVRSKFPDDHKFAGLVADFVIARREVKYESQSRVPITEYGTLYDDLVRRDFTVNAIAKDIDGNYIDHFNGRNDIRDRVLRTPTDAAISFNQDPLRILRGFRFAITKKFHFSDNVLDSIRGFDADRMKIVSTERVRNELRGMFKHDTKKTLHYLHFMDTLNSDLYDTLFRDNLWFEPTKRKK